MANHVYLSLGSNQGDRQSYLYQALKTLENHEEVNVVRCSSIFETDPYGPVVQPDYLNMVAYIQTSLLPEELLFVTQQIENGLGRKREIRWGPRTIDLDILVYNQDNVSLDHLQIPHAEMENRGFVILPLYEIAPNLKIPGQKMPLETLYKKFSKLKGVRLWKKNNGEGEFGLFGS